MLNTIGRRIGFGYAIIGIVMAVCLLAMYFMTRGILDSSRRTSDVRAPTTTAASRVLMGLANAQPSLRLWVADRDHTALADVRESWRDRIEPGVEALTALARHWGREENRKAFAEFQARIGELRATSLALEGMEDRQRALQELNQKLVPLAGLLRARLETLIENQTRDLEDDLEVQELALAQVNLTRVALIVVVLLLSLGAGIAMSRAVGGPLAQAISLADMVAAGNFSTKIEVAGMEELNRLGAALERMRANLERQSWLQQAQIRLYESVQGVATPRELADAVTSMVASTSQAAVAALHVAEERSLRTIGGFALPPPSAGAELAFGSGIAGQAAAERRPISVAGEGGQGLELVTMQGNVRPREALAAPLVFRDEVVGVLELSSVTGFGAKEREFIQMAAQAAAITLSSAQKAEQVRNLLAETQAQAEELQAQQEELRNANEELQTRQEELEASNEELEEQKSLLESQKIALDQKAEELNRVSRYKSEFLANMSHELRTPLNSQLILSALLEENKEGNLSQKQLEFARMINASGRNLLQLINDILDLSKVEAGKLAVEVQEVGVEDLVEGLRRDFVRSAEQKGLRLVTELGPELPSAIYTDPLRLGQVLRNLLSNALKFTETGEIRVHIVPAASREGERMVSFRVSDTGIGIPADKLSAIFGAFEQVDSSISRKYGGTGLGLAISKGLAELLGGSLEVASRTGEGTTFTLTVPWVLKNMEAPRAPLPERAQDPSRARIVATAGVRRVLVVDDEPEQRQHLLRLLASEKVLVSGVATAEEALEALRSAGPFDCIVLDLRLPGQSGLALLEKIRSERAVPLPPVVIHTAKDLSRDEEERLRRHSDSIIIKGLRSNDRLLEEVGLILRQPGGREAPRESSGGKADPALDGARVLLVDDDIRNVFSLSSAMEDRGMNVVVARDGAEALKTLEADSGIQLVLMDIMMPVMDGHEAMRRIRKDKRHVNLPIIALTAKAMRGDKEACLESGANDYLAKPVDLNQFFTLLRVWLGK